MRAQPADLIPRFVGSMHPPESSSRPDFPYRVAQQRQGCTACLRLFASKSEQTGSPEIASVGCSSPDLITTLAEQFLDHRAERNIRLFELTRLGTLHKNGLLSAISPDNHSQFSACPFVQGSLKPP
jgi:hypothetical protein